MKLRSAVVFGSLAAGAAAIGIAAATSRYRYESAPYTVTFRQGRFEVRDYPDLVVAETPMRGGDDASFGKLFRFISGANETRQKIAMTTPVFIGNGESPDTMSFVLPKALADRAPTPKDASVTLKNVPAGRFASMSFPGSIDRARESALRRDLMELVEKHGLVAIGEPVICYFDPPWTPGFFRRNEVLVRVGQ